MKTASEAAILSGQVVTGDAIQASYDRVYADTKDRNIGLVLAVRPMGQIVADCYGLSNGTPLSQVIQTNGFGYIPIRWNPTDIDATERPVSTDPHAYLVCGSTGDDSGNLKGFLRKFVRAIGGSALFRPCGLNEAFLMKPSENGAPGDELLEVGNWHPNRTAEFLRLIKGQANEVIAEEDGNRLPQYIVTKSFFVLRDRLY